MSVFPTFSAFTGFAPLSSLHGRGSVSPVGSPARTPGGQVPRLGSNLAWSGEVGPARRRLGLQTLEDGATPGLPGSGGGASGTTLDPPADGGNENEVCDDDQFMYDDADETMGGGTQTSVGAQQPRRASQLPTRRASQLSTPRGGLLPIHREIDERESFHRAMIACDHVGDTWQCCICSTACGKDSGQITGIKCNTCTCLIITFMIGSG